MHFTNKLRMLIQITQSLMLVENIWRILLCLGGTILLCIAFPAHRISSLNSRHLQN
jgi:hypothetical protein